MSEYLGSKAELEIEGEAKITQLLDRVNFHVVDPDYIWGELEYMGRFTVSYNRKSSGVCVRGVANISEAMELIRKLQEMVSVKQVEVRAAVLTHRTKSSEEAEEIASRLKHHLMHTRLCNLVLGLHEKVWQIGVRREHDYKHNCEYITVALKFEADPETSLKILELLKQFEQEYLDKYSFGLA